MHIYAYMLSFTSSYFSYILKGQDKRPVNIMKTLSTFLQHYSALVAAQEPDHLGHNNDIDKNDIDDNDIDDNDIDDNVIDDNVIHNNVIDDNGVDDNVMSMSLATRSLMTKTLI